MKVIDLFSGCGGLSKGFENAGFRVMAAYDAWEPAVKCYRANFHHPIFQSDLSQIDKAVRNIRAYNPDIIIGGPPCQDFSHAGKRTEGQRANLTTVYANIVRRIRPTWFLMENVDRARKSLAFQSARLIFKAAGYGLSEHTLNANAYGVPQNRMRFICIGKQGEEDGFLDELILESANPTPFTVRDFLGDELNTRYFYRHPRNYNRRAVFSIDEPAPTVRGVNRPIPKGYPGHPIDAAPISRRVRPLTTLERARLQTFPPEFKWVGTKTDLEQIIGNAVPVKLAEKVARCIMKWNKSIGVKPISRRKQSANEYERLPEMVGI